MAISQRIDELLSQPVNHDAAIKYLDVLRSNLRSCVELFDRRSSVLFLTVFTFELLTHAGASEASLMGLKISDLTLVEKLLPLGIGYLYYSLASIISYRRLLEEVHDEIMRVTAPEFFSRDLEYYGHPPTVFHIEAIIARGTSGRFRAVKSFLVAPLQLTIAIGPALYLVYAVGRLYWRFGVADPLVWITAIAVGLFLLQVAWQIEGVSRLSGK
jgi:hypothetical protein